MWGNEGRGACHAIMQEVTPSVVPRAVRMLMRVWMMNLQVSFLLIRFSNLKLII